MQVADNIASQGHKVIIFSLEQSRFELVSKALSRITHINKPADARKHTEIMQKENIDEVTQRAIADYQSTIAPNEIIEEGNFNTNVDTIREYIADYIANTKERPTIVIDYLQILAPSNTKYTDKQQIDYNVTTLKKISRDFNIPIIVISSFNRQNYYQNVTLEAFKESGGIEYTADVLLGMQLRVLRDIKRTADGKLKDEDKKIVDDASKEIPRQIELVCLKNRSGQKFNTELDFNPVFNHLYEPRNY